MALTPQNDTEWIACQQTIAAMRRGEDPFSAAPYMTPSSIYITDIELLALVGFTRQSEQALICSFALERGLSVRALLAMALRSYHTQTVVGPEYLLKHMLGRPIEPPEPGTYLLVPPPGHPDHQPYGCPALD